MRFPLVLHARLSGAACAPVWYCKLGCCL